jgi:hypothetical protein
MKMKYTLLALMLVLFTTITTAQDKVKKSKRVQTENGKVFVNLATGINNPTGPLGVGIDAAIAKNIMIGAGIGTSTWGTKISAKGVFFLKENFHGGAFAISINHSSGFAYSKMKYEPKNSNTTYLLDTEGSRLTSVNLMYANYRNIGKKSKFYFQTGFAAKLNTPTVTIYYAGTTNTFNDKLYTQSLKLLAPGGLIANIGFLIAIQ